MCECVCAQLCLTLCDRMDCSLPGPWNFPGKNVGLGRHFLLQGIFQTQGLNLHLLCLLDWQVDSFPLRDLGSQVQGVEHGKGLGRTCPNKPVWTSYWGRAFLSDIMGWLWPWPTSLCSGLLIFDAVNKVHLYLEDEGVHFLLLKCESVSDVNGHHFCGYPKTNVQVGVGALKMPLKWLAIS